MHEMRVEGMTGGALLVKCSCGYATAIDGDYAIADLARLQEQHAPPPQDGLSPLRQEFPQWSLHILHAFPRLEAQPPGSPCYCADRFFGAGDEVSLIADSPGELRGLIEQEEARRG